jgi:hypothetical protein
MADKKIEFKTYNEFVDYIIKLRYEKGYSMRDMSKLMGRGLNTIVLFEKKPIDFHNYNNLAMLMQYCNILGVKFSYLASVKSI